MCLLYMLEKENLVKIRKYLLGPSRYDCRYKYLVEMVHIMFGYIFWHKRFSSDLATLLYFSSIWLKNELNTCFDEQTSFKSNTVRMRDKEQKETNT